MDEKEYVKMNNLEILSSIIDKIKKHRYQYESSEEAVRNQIVNPILRILGWDPENPEEVQHNVSIEEGIPDYTLFKNQKKILFVEAKKLGLEIKEKEFRQLGRYSYDAGTKYGVLTNGAVWILHRSFEEGKSVNERVVWKVDLENDNIPSVFRKLSTISKDNVEQIETLVEKSQIIEKIWISLLEKPEELIKGLIPVLKTHIGKEYSSFQFNEAEIEDFLTEKIKEITPEITQDIPIDTGIEIPPPIYHVNETQGKSPSKKPKRMRLAGEVFAVEKANELLLNRNNYQMDYGSL